MIAVSRVSGQLNNLSGAEIYSMGDINIAGAGGSGRTAYVSKNGNRFIFATKNGLAKQHFKTHHEQTSRRT